MLINYKNTSAFLICLSIVMLLSMVQVQQVKAAEILRWGDKGESVKQLQNNLSQLGYDTYGVDGIFGANTYQAVVKFQKDANINADGLVGQLTNKALEKILINNTYVLQKGDNLSSVADKFKISVHELIRYNGLTSWVLNPGTVLKIPLVKNIEPSRGGVRFGQLVDWWTVANNTFALNKVATITDIETGITYRVIRKGGSNHADCQPLTATDTAAMLKVYGGDWNWARRAILVTVDGRTMAASQNGMPHGGQSIYDNNFPGHFCIHFQNSRTHGTNKVDTAHQSMILKAAGR